jgi:hypothetical protein
MHKGEVPNQIHLLSNMYLRTTFNLFIQMGAGALSNLMPRSFALSDIKSNHKHEGISRAERFLSNH